MRLNQPVSRRALLVASALGLVGCQSHRPASRPTPVNPDAAALAAARDGELMLIASYEAALHRAQRRARPALLAARATHEVHLHVLQALTPHSTADIAAVRDLPAALRGSARTLRRSAVTAREGSTAALLASIGASHQAAGR